MTKQTKPKTFTFEGIELEEVSEKEYEQQSLSIQGAVPRMIVRDAFNSFRYFLPVNRKKPKKCEKCGHILEEKKE